MKFDDEMLHSRIATFAGSNYVFMDDVKKYEVAVIGVSIDMGASYRLGVKMGPRSIREYSITYGWFVGVKNIFKDKRIGIVHFDAHNDTEPNADNLAEINHCN